MKLNFEMDYEAYSIDSSYYDQYAYLALDDNKSYRFMVGPNNKALITKSELAEIMDGAFYKVHEASAEWNEWEHPDWKYNPDADKYEWKNPLIELEPDPVI